jgi:uncharacterized protein
MIDNEELSNHSTIIGPTWRWYDVLLIFVGIIAFFLLGFTVLWITLRPTSSMFVETFQPSIVTSLILAFMEFFALVGSVYILGLRRKGLRWKDLGLRGLSMGWLIVTLALSVVVIPLSGLISALILAILDQPLTNPQLDFLIPEGFNWIGAIGMLVLGGIAVPFAEELIFRGVIYKWLRENWGLWPGILISSFLFGIVHVDPSVAGAAFVLGIILALVYEYSRSLWSAVLIHAINNSVKIVLLYALVAFGVNITI